MRMSAILACVVSIGASAVGASQEPKPTVSLPKYPVAALVAAIYLPTAELRARAVEQLAARTVPIDSGWLQPGLCGRKRRAASALRPHVLAGC